jgi:hypothetical protein
MKPAICRYALNSTGLLIQTHDAPVPSSNRTSRHESILKCWHTWCANMHERMLPLVSRDHRVGFLGALSARKWRDRVRLWAEVAVEVAASKMLSCAMASAMVQVRKLTFRRNTRIRASSRSWHWNGSRVGDSTHTFLLNFEQRDTSFHRTNIFPI